MLVGIALYFFLKVLGINLGICCFVWGFLKFIGAEKEAKFSKYFGLYPIILNLNNSIIKCYKIFNESYKIKNEVMEGD